MSGGVNPFLFAHAQRCPCHARRQAVPVGSGLHRHYTLLCIDNVIHVYMCLYAVYYYTIILVIYWYTILLLQKSNLYHTLYIAAYRRVQFIQHDNDSQSYDVIKLNWFPQPAKLVWALLYTRKYWQCQSLHKPGGPPRDPWSNCPETPLVPDHPHQHEPGREAKHYIIMMSSPYKETRAFE